MDNLNVKGSVELISEVLPAGSLKFNKPIEIKKSLALAHLVITLTAESAEAIVQGRYKNFDALVKNFGCQMTMCELFQLVSQPALLFEAERVQALAKEHLAKCQALMQKNNLALKDTEDIKQAIGVKTSSVMVRLVRLRILAVVNDSKLIIREGMPREQPKTNIELLLVKVAATSMKKCINGLVNTLQAEESKKAEQYILEKASGISNARGSLIRQTLALSINSGGIVSLPLLYNTEAVLASMEGILLIKNKMLVCGTLKVNAKPLQIYMYMPECKPIDPSLMNRLVESQPKMPLYVIEGYVNDAISTNQQFIEAITFIGLDRIIRAECAILPQYIDKSVQIDNDEALLDITKLKNDQSAREVIELEHFYCASLQEELDVGKNVQQKLAEAEFSVKQKENSL